MSTKKTLKGLSKKLYSLSDDIMKDVVQFANEDGAKLAKQMVDGYYDYVLSKGRITVWSAKKLPKRLAKLSRFKYEWTEMEKMPSALGTISGASPVRLPSYNGCTVGIRGKDVAYYEFGTGSVGSSKVTYDNLYMGSYPDKHGWQYNVGTHIISNPNIMGGLSKAEHWYGSFVQQNPQIVDPGSPVWMRKRYATRGIEPGGFCYRVIGRYRNALKKADAPQTVGYTSKGSTYTTTDEDGDAIKLSRGSITNYIRSKLD